MNILKVFQTVQTIKVLLGYIFSQVWPIICISIYLNNLIISSSVLPFDIKTDSLSP